MVPPNRIPPRDLPPGLTRRAAVLGAAGGLWGAAGDTHALPARALVFPRDFGAHPELRTEWWYITGAVVSQATGAPAREFGFQLTFFRTRVDATQGMNSQFAAKQLIFAHAAVTDLQGRKLWHDQRIAREGFGVAFASTKDTELKLRDWTLSRQAGTGTLPSRYRASIAANEFSLELEFAETQPLLLQGQQGLSRKGPDAAQASYYYSKPQLQTRGQLTLRGQPYAVAGKSWLDHEASEELLHPEAQGWDWIGMNLDDGSALTAFRLRNAAGGAIWDGGSFRRAGAPAQNFSAGAVQFEAVRVWVSPLTQARYPVVWRVRTPVGVYTVRAVIDNQELDSRASTGAVYWEGLSDLLDDQGKRLGRGYLEMTGYASPLRL